MRKICIGEYSLKYRKTHGLNQAEFGQLLGVSAVSVSKWEREICYPDIFLLADLASLLDVSIDEMLGRAV